jgi:2-keto-4-pentenoate hydratase/2-oxohepta-3-ene-1,7-dioic acid hydratase in catechol pathway
VAIRFDLATTVAQIEMLRQPVVVRGQPADPRPSLLPTPIRRPHGQFKLPGDATPTFASTAQLDYELEVAAYIGTIQSAITLS